MVAREIANCPTCGPTLLLYHSANCFVSLVLGRLSYTISIMWACVILAADDNGSRLARHNYQSGLLVVAFPNCHETCHVGTCEPTSLLYDHAQEFSTETGSRQAEVSVNKADTGRFVLNSLATSFPYPIILGPMCPTCS